MSSCLSGAGGRTIGFDFDFVKSPSTWTRTSQTSSPSSTISESSNSPFAISTRKPRTPRKRPNQTYNEAAAVLSTAYPNLFSTENLKKPGKFTKPTNAFLEESPELLLPFRVFDNSSFPLLQPIPHRPTLSIESKVVNNLHEKSCQSPGEISSRVNCLELDDEFEDFDAESILDEEIDEGIDSIMGSRADGESNSASENPCSGICFGGKIDFRLGLRRAGVRALRRVDEVNWWNFPTVDILQISPKISNPPASASTEKKKKKKKVEKPKLELKNSENSIPKWNKGLMLKLNYDEILNAWSDQGSPFGDEGPSSDVSGNDVARFGDEEGRGESVWAKKLIPKSSLSSQSSNQTPFWLTRLAQIDLFPENGGVREASVLRYKEKRRTRLFAKKIRYQVKKVNADRRPRIKGRFVRRANSCSVGER